MLIWGFNFVAAKYGLADFSPLLLMTLRFALVAALLVPFARRPRAKIGQIFLLSVTFAGLHFSILFMGLAGVDAAAAAIAIQLQVPFAALLAALVFKDRLGWRRALGMTVAFAGVVVIAGQPRVSENLGHLMLVILAAFAFAVASVQMKLIGTIDRYTLQGWMSLFAVPQLALASWLTESGQWQQIREASWSGWAALVYIAVMATIVAHGSWYSLLRRYDVNQCMPYTLTVPVFGVLASVLVLGEPLTLDLVIGGALTLAGVAVIVIRRPATTAPAPVSAT